MNGAFYIGATGLRAEQRALDATANNIANLNTLGFKRSEVRFAELIGAQGADRNQGESAALGGVTAASTGQIFTQGEIRRSGNVMDVAIQGEGFIELLGPEGTTLAWRGGALKVNDDGFMAAANGMPLKSMISVPKGAQGLTIGRDGVVRALASGDAVPSELGRIDILMVENTARLTPQGEGVYGLAETNGGQVSAPGEEGAGVLLQGAVETSNVELSDELVALLVTQRAYAANAQVIQAGDQLMAIANGLKR